MKEQTMISQFSRDSSSTSPSADGIETKPSDDSSVFSGLGQSSGQLRLNDDSYDSNLIPPPPPPMEAQQQKYISQKSGFRANYDDGILKKKNGRLATVSLDSDTFSVDHMGSDTICGYRSTISVSSMEKRNENLSIVVSNNSIMNVQAKNMKDVENLISDEDSNTQTSWATSRSKGAIKLVSTVTFAGDDLIEGDDDENDCSIGNCKSNDSDSRIVEMLNDFGKKMDANLKIIEEENADENDVLLNLRDSSPLRVRSEEDSGSENFLTPHKSKKLQRILHKAREEVKILRDNNEQFKSEIEGMEEEHKSEIKLFEDRAKQKLGELKNLYQSEIDSLVQEKDGAISEAGRVSARYAETGKKQVTIMQKQIDRLKAAAMVTMKEQIERARRDATTEKDNEITSKMKALQISHECELEKLRIESNQRVKDEIENAVSSVSKRVRLNQDVLVSELREQLESIRSEQHTIVDLLESVKTKFDKHYPNEMILFEESSDSCWGSARKLLDNDNDNDRRAEKVLKEVLETFTFLLEASEEKFASARSQAVAHESEKECNEVQGEMRKHLVLSHRAEIKHLKNDKDEIFEKLRNAEKHLRRENRVLEEKYRSELETKDEIFEKLRNIEKSFKDVSREKCLLEEQQQRELVNHQLELERLRLEKKTFLDIERSRKNLEHAMVTGKRELANLNKSRSGEYHFAASIMNNCDKSNKLGLQQGLHEEAKDRDPLELEFQYSLSIPTPRSSSEKPDNKQRASPLSPSVRRTRFFQRNRPKFSPRHSSTNSPRHQDLVQAQAPSKQPDVISNRTKQVPSDIGGMNVHKLKPNLIQDSYDKKCQIRDTPLMEILHGTSFVDPKLETSDCSFRSESSLSNLRNRARKTEGQDLIVVTTLSDGSTAINNNDTMNSIKSTDKNVRSKDTALSNLRSQSKKRVKQNEDMMMKDERYGDEGNRVDFKIKNKDIYSTQRNAPHTAIEKQSDVNKGTNNIMIRSLRKARNFKNYLEPNRNVESSSVRSIRSSGDNISSLRTNTGITIASKEDAESGDRSIISTRRETQKESRITRVLHARQSKILIEGGNEMNQVANNIDEIETLRSIKRSTNAIEMFAQGRKKKQTENEAESESQILGGDEIESDDEVTIPSPPSPTHNTNGNMGKTQNIFAQGSRVENEDKRLEESGSHLYLRNPPLSIAQEHLSIKGEKSVFGPNNMNMNGKKSNDIHIFEETCSSDSDIENSSPISITVHGGGEKSQAAMSSGHTLLSKTLPIHNPKIDPQETLSNLSAGTSEVITSSNDGSELMYGSQVQMRKIPPLTDDSEDEESGVCAQDKYEAIDSPKVGGGGILFLKTENVDDRPNKSTSKNNNDGGQERHGLAAFRPVRPREASIRKTHSDASSTAGNCVSQATTAVTAHTRKSASFFSSKNLGRFSPLKARVRVTRVEI